LTLVSPQSSGPQNLFQDFFRSFQTDEIESKYHKRIAQVILDHGRSLVIDFEDLISFDPVLARSVAERPDDYIGYASSAATAQMRLEDPEYAEHVRRIYARFRRLPEESSLTRIGAGQVGKLVRMKGIVVKVEPKCLVIDRAVFRCRRCLEVLQIEQSGDLMRGPGVACPACKQKTAWELLEEKSKFRNTQVIWLVECKKKGQSLGRLLVRYEARLEDDLVDSFGLKESIDLVAIVRVKLPASPGLRVREFRLCLEVNSAETFESEADKTALDSS
jgi:replicative DNA helicase Mcm